MVPTAIDGALLSIGAHQTHARLTELVVDSHCRAGKSLAQAQADAEPVVLASFRIACELRGHAPDQVWLPRSTVKIGRATIVRETT